MKKILALFLSVLLLFGIVATVSSGSLPPTCFRAGRGCGATSTAASCPRRTTFPARPPRAQPPERVEDDAAVAAGVYRRLPVFSPAASEHYPYRAQTLGGISAWRATRSAPATGSWRSRYTSFRAGRGENGCFSLGTVVLPGVKLSEGEIRVALSAFTADHPEIFWLANLFGYAYDDGDTQVRLYSQLSYSTAPTA